jgi:hypothetical protein
MHSKIFDVATDKISKKLKNIQPDDIQSIMNNITKTYQSLKPEKKKDLGMDEAAVDTKSSDEVFFECVAAPSKPNRQKKQNGKGKYERQRSGSLGTVKIERDSALGTSRDSLNTWPHKGTIFQSKQYDHLRVPANRLSYSGDTEVEGNQFYLQWSKI